jgi:myosin-6
MSSQRVWVSSPGSGFITGEIVDLGSDRVTVSIREGSKNVQKDVPYESVFPAEEDDRADYEDNCSLMFLNEATLLHNVKIRFAKGDIYVRGV